MNIQPNTKQEVMGHAVVGIAGGLVGLAVTGGKVQEALACAVVGVVAHVVMDRPVTAYIATHPQEFPRYLAS